MGDGGDVIKEIKRGRHGGTRPGAGRKPSKDRRPSCADCGDPRAAALARTVKGSSAFQFTLAMFALGASIDETWRALGTMSQAQFAAMYLAGSNAPGDLDA